MRSVSAGEPRAWSICTDGPIQGFQIDLLKQTVVFPWSQFLCAEGDDAEIRLTFATYEITVKGAGLTLLLADMREQRAVLLEEPRRAERFAAESWPRITGISLRKLE